VTWSDVTTLLGQLLGKPQKRAPPPQPPSPQYCHSRFFAVFDFENGYYQGPISERASFIYAIITSTGVYRPLRVPFGAQNAPIWFHNAVSRMFRDLPCVETVFDDCALGAPDFGTFVYRLVRFLDRCIDNKVKLKASKCKIGQLKLSYVGRLLTGYTIEIDPERLSPLLAAAAPYDKSTVRSCLGAVNWFLPFVPGLATIAAPLYHLTRRDQPFVWGTAGNSVFEKIKALLRTAPILEHPDPEASLILRTDASSRGIAGVLLQRRTDGKIGILSFYSRKMIPAERKYSTIELEALAIVWCLDKARQFINGAIEIHTDHSNLSYLNSSQKPSCAALECYLE